MQTKEIKKKAKTAVSRFDSDVLFGKIGQTLVKDFRVLTDKPNEFGDVLEAYKLGVEHVHTMEFPNYHGADYINFKCWYQLESLVKRYTSPRDFMTPQERKEKTIKKFLQVQQEVPSKRPSTLRAHLVLQKARSIARRILGKFNKDEVYSHVAYGKRANTGVPYSQSYLHRKFGMISGSPEHVLWFNQTYLPQDKILSMNIPLTNRSRDEHVQSLALACVPKKHDIDRTVMPNTVIGTFYTNAIMAMIESRLSASGYHIPSLQEKHSGYAQYGSQTGKLATGDLSSASDLPGFALMCPIFPRDWLNAMRFGRIRKFKYGGKTYHLESFMAMGINYTFPAETLLFLVLLKAIAELTNIRGLISVYGDDLIYPSPMAPYVSQIFGDLGLKFNKEKSFSTGHFRESCGSDFMYGKPVRPFQPEVLGGKVPTHIYRTLLFKIINGLRRRWKETEIPSTLHYLHCELHRVGGGCFIPPSFPDTSGVHLFPQDDPLWASGFHFHAYLSGLHSLWYHEYKRPTWCNFKQALIFSYYRQVFDKHYVSKEGQAAYYWDALRLSSNQDDIEPSSTQYLEPVDSTTLDWEEQEYTVRTSSGRLSKLIPFVPDKSSKMRTVRNEGSTSRWI